MGSVVLPHLNTAWHVDQAILSEDERLVVIRFGRDGDPDCMKMDEVLFKIADRVKNFAAVYVCDIDQVPDFNQIGEAGAYRHYRDHLPRRKEGARSGSKQFRLYREVRLLRSIQADENVVMRLRAASRRQDRRAISSLWRFGMFTRQGLPMAHS
ncbi:hypothetical protein RB594_006606 [Gaeumannomyces avenae]